jgi:hypothetical protein
MTLLGGLVIIPGQAAADDSRCPANTFCLYRNINFGGGRATFGGDDNDLRDNHYDNNLIVQDSASSMINNTGRIVVLYNGINKVSSVYAAAKESVDSTFVNNNCNDIVSSLDFV